MKKIFRTNSAFSAILVIVFSLFFAAKPQAQCNVQAYSGNAVAGNQGWQGSLGMDFNVNTTIQVTQLGAYDDGGTGLTAGSQAGPNSGIRVAIYNRVTQTIVPGLDMVISGNADPLVTFHRMRAMAPVFLGPGQYSIVANGFNAIKQNHNAGFSGIPTTTNNGGGAITFVGGGRYDNPGPISYPPNVDGGPAGRYHAGTFTFTTTPQTVTNSNNGKLFCSIQSAIDDPMTVNGNTILVAAGVYNEDVLVNKEVKLIGAGIGVSTVSGPIGGPGSTFAIAASNVIVQGFTITRAGNNLADWNNPGLNSAGISIQGPTITNAIIRNNHIEGNRSGIDINNSSGNSVINNEITNNRTGLIFRNQTDNMNVQNNYITNNWTVGILFLDGSGGTNSPLNQALNSLFNNNDLSGNWYGAIVDRQTGGSLPPPGANPKNFRCNWYGHVPPVITNANSTEPGYTAQIPVAYGGGATAPGGQPDIAGPASANFQYIQFLTSGTDASPATGFQPTPGSCNGCPNGTVTNINTGLSYCSIQAAIDAALTVNGHTLQVGSGNYNEQVKVYKSVTLVGVGLTQPLVNYTGVVSPKPTLFDVSADNVTIDNIHFNVDLSKLKSAIIVSGVSIDNITVKNNVIDAYGNPSPGIYGDRNAVSVNYGGPTNYRVALNGVDNVVFQNNRVNGSGLASYFRAAIAVDEAGGLFTGNTSQTINHDVLVRFGSNGPVTVTNNICNGGGIELDDMNAGAGAQIVSGNTFNAAFAQVSAPGTAVLRLRDNFNSKPTFVSNNSFFDVFWGISLENYNTVTISENEFTPTANSTNYHHIGVNTKVYSTSSNTAPQVTIDANIQNNTFNGSGMNGGTGILFMNHDADQASFGVFNVHENSFDVSISNAIAEDAQFGPSGASTFPNYNQVITFPQPPGAITSMAPWLAPINATCNWYGTTNSASIAGKVGPHVTYSPFLTSGTDTDGDTKGFQPAANTCGGPLPVLTVTINGNTLTANNDGNDETATIKVCNVSDNMTFSAISDLNGSMPAGQVMIRQEFLASNSTICCPDGDFPIGVYGGTFSRSANSAPGTSGQLTIRLRAYFDSNGNNSADPGEPTGDWLIYTVKIDGQAPVLTIPADQSVECDAVPAPGSATATDDLDPNPSVQYQGEVITPSSSNMAYSSSLTNGNQEYQERLGMVFTANGPVRVTHLGAFDDGQNGLSRPITVGIVRNSDGATVVGPITLSGTSDPLDGKYRVRAIPAVTLPAGQYIIVAVGYGPGEANGNSNVGGPATTFNSGGGLLTSDSSPYGGVGFGKPTTPFPTPSIFHAGTFRFGCPNNYSITRTWKATDACGNSSSKSQTITVSDNTPPVITCPNSITVQCAGDVPPHDFAGGTATDNCSGPVNVVWVADAVTPGSCANRFTVTRTYRATDACGNSSTCTQTITVYDNTAPVITCPANKVIPFLTTCDYNAGTGNTGFATAAADNCGGLVTITFSDNVQQCGNNIVITRTWKAADICGNASTCNQTITVTDNTTPYLIYATKEVKFGESNMIGGDVGVTDAKGKAEFKKNSVLNPYHVYAKEINVQLPSSVANVHYVPATGGPVVPWAPYVANPLSGNYTQTTSGTVPAGNYKNLTNKGGLVVTVNGSDYGKISIEEGAKVTFTSSSINLEELSVGKGKNSTATTDVKFTQCTGVKVRDRVKIEEDCRINVMGPRVSFYLGDAKKDEENFQVKGDDTWVTANIYIPNGKLKVNGGNSNAMMTGLFIVEKLESDGKFVTWSPYGCAPLTFSRGTRIDQPVEVKETLVVSQPPVVAPAATETFQVKAYPNPSSIDFSLQVLTSSTEPITVRLMDLSGHVLRITNPVSKGSLIKLGSDLKAGTYFAEVIQGDNKQVIKLIKLN